jgi:hypothetical protein
MSLTTTSLTRAAGLCAVAAGVLFIAVQINHPPMDLAFASTTEYLVRQSMKIVMAVLTLTGIAGMYLSQVRKNGVLGLLGYLTLAFGFLAMLTVEVVGLVVLPAIAGSSPSYVSSVLAVATNGLPTQDIGLLAPLNTLVGLGYMAGGLLFGIALFRAKVLSRWGSILLAVATPLSAAIPLLPMINQRLFAVPTGLAMIVLGWSLWRTSRGLTADVALATESRVPVSVS